MTTCFVLLVCTAQDEYFILACSSRETVHGTQELIVPREEELYLPVSDVEVQTITMM